MRKSTRRDQRLRRIASALAAAPLRPDAIAMVLAAFHATGEVPDDARLAAGVLDRLEGDRVPEPVDLATGIQLLVALAARIEAGELPAESAVSDRRRLVAAVQGARSTVPAGPPVPDTPTLLRDAQRLGDLAAELGVLDEATGAAPRPA